MNDAVQLMGFLAAQMLSFRSRGVEFPAIAMFDRGDGPPQIIQLTESTGDKSARLAEKLLKENRQGAKCAAFAIDSFLNLPPSRIDAVYLQGRSYGKKQRTFQIAVPYRRHDHKDGFAIHRPKLILFEGEELAADVQTAFSAGITGHGLGKQLLDTYLDLSR